MAILCGVPGVARRAKAGGPGGSALLREPLVLSALGQKQTLFSDDTGRDISQCREQNAEPSASFLPS